MHSTRLFFSGAILLYLYSVHCTPLGHPVHNDVGSCRKTKVAVLGAGMAGITAAKTLSDRGIRDFIIVERNDRIGGRVWSVPFGHRGGQAGGVPYVVELGANWVHGTKNDNRPENPIFSLAEKHDLASHLSNYSNALVFDSSGAVDPDTVVNLTSEFELAFSETKKDADVMLLNGLPDRSLRNGLLEQHWDPQGDPLKLVMEWYAVDFELAQTADVSSQLFSTVASMSTHAYFSEDNLLVNDPRGYETIIHEEAKEILGEDLDDSRLLLKHRVSHIDNTDNSKIIVWTDRSGAGGCIEAEYAIMTFSLGVLKQPDAVQFYPKLPTWKKRAINKMQMGTYTKIFMQFPPDDVFWDKSVQFHVHASEKKGYYPVFQNLDHKDFYPGSGILFATVVGDQALRVERQADEETKEQLMQVLREMFPEKNIPKPLDFYYPRWSTTDWAYGSYSNVPPGMTLEMRENLRANVGRLWFAGEHTSINWFGFLQGAYFEGQKIGERLAARLNGDTIGGEELKYYAVPNKTTDPSEWNDENGVEEGTLKTLALFMSEEGAEA